MRTLLMLLVMVTVCRADYYVEYIWYRVEPEQSRIVITWEHLRGYKAVNRFADNKEKHEAEGKYFAQDYGIEKKVFVKEEHLDGHMIKTVITIWPPRGYGKGGCAPNAHIMVYFDGNIRVDCPFGFRNADNVTIQKIVIYAEHESAKAEFRNEIEKTGREVWNFFDLGDEILVFEDGEL